MRRAWRARWVQRLTVRRRQDSVRKAHSWDVSLHYILRIGTDIIRLGRYQGCTVVSGKARRACGGGEGGKEEKEEKEESLDVITAHAACRS